MSIKDWPASERPREKLLEYGENALSDAELLAIFLGRGVGGLSAVDLARQHLQELGGLRALLTLDQCEMMALHGLGPATCALLLAARELGRRCLQETLKRTDSLADPASARTFVHDRLRDEPHEVFACLFLDTRNRLIKWEILFRGSIDSASVHPRSVVKQSLRHNAAAVIFTHNHPSGIAEPSQADQRITDRLKASLALIDVRVLDHLIVGDGYTYSFAEEGLL